jgi:hypothetical protein
MPGKRSKSSQSSGRKKAAVPANKKKRKKKHNHNANSVYYEYDQRPDFQTALDNMRTDVETIWKKLDENDLNTAPTEGIHKRIVALKTETTKTKLQRPAHDNRIERILYAIGGMNDQYYINKKRPVIQAQPPSTVDPHEKKVVTLFTTVNNICREVFSLLDSKTLAVQPKPDGKNVTDYIVEMAQDTQMVVDNILTHILHDHPGPSASK